MRFIPLLTRCKIALPSCKGENAVEFVANFRLTFVIVKGGSEGEGAPVGDKVLVFENDIKTRAFAGVDLKSGGKLVLAIIAAVDAALKLFSREVFYLNPRPHVSVFWWNMSPPPSSVEAEDGKPKKRLKAENPPPTEIGTLQHCTTVQVSQLICKIGKDEFIIKLP